MAGRDLARIVISIATATIWLLVGVPTASAAAPEFRLVPDRGTCTASPQYVAVQSANIPAGHTVVFAKLPQGNSFPLTVVHNGVGAPAMLALAFCEPITPDGTTITFELWERPEPIIPGNIRTGQLYATATFTVDSAAGPLPILAPPAPGLPNTGQGGMARSSVGLAQFLVAAIIGIGIGGCARWRRLSRAARFPTG